MNYVWLIPYYIAWHYTRGIKDLSELLINFLSFIKSFFSISVMLRTFFTPFEGLGSRYRGHFDVKDFFSTLIVNTIMRAYGVVARSAVIALGIISFVITLISGLIFFVLWLVAPIVLSFFFVLGLLALFGIA